MEHLTTVGVGGILALLVLREVFQFLARWKAGREPAGNGAGRGRRGTDPLKDVRSNVEAVLTRLDRIIERLDDMSDGTKAARKQSEITCEHTERMVRAVQQLERAINDATRRNDGNPVAT